MNLACKQLRTFIEDFFIDLQELAHEHNDINYVHFTNCLVSKNS